MPETSKTYLFIINDGPYGSERPYNALRLAMKISNQENVLVRIFLVGDGVNVAIRNQRTPNGYYNIERMLSSITRRGEVAT